MKASELSELVGKAFKAAFTKRSLKREKKKKKQQPQRSPSPQPPPPPQQTQPWSVQRDPAPHHQVILYMTQLHPCSLTFPGFVSEPHLKVPFPTFIPSPCSI